MSAASDRFERDRRIARYRYEMISASIVLCSLLTGGLSLWLLIQPAAAGLRSLGWGCLAASALGILLAIVRARRARYL